MPSNVFFSFGHVYFSSQKSNILPSPPISCRASRSGYYQDKHSVVPNYYLQQINPEITCWLPEEI